MSERGETVGLDSFAEYAEFDLSEDKIDAMMAHAEPVELADPEEAQARARARRRRPSWADED